MHAEGHCPGEVLVAGRDMVDTDARSAVMAHPNSGCYLVVGCTIETVHLVLLIDPVPSFLV